MPGIFRREIASTKRRPLKCRRDFIRFLTPSILQNATFGTTILGIWWGHFLVFFYFLKICQLPKFPPPSLLICIQNSNLTQKSLNKIFPNLTKRWGRSWSILHPSPQFSNPQQQHVIMRANLVCNGIRHYAGPFQWNLEARVSMAVRLTALHRSMYGFTNKSGLCAKLYKQLGRS